LSSKDEAWRGLAPDGKCPGLIGKLGRWKKRQKNLNLFGQAVEKKNKEKILKGGESHRDIIIRFLEAKF
jgi:hypothetical protein